MAVYMGIGSARVLPICLSAIAIILIIWSFLHLNINSPSPQAPPEQEQVTQERPTSALDEDPLRIYVPPDVDIPWPYDEAPSAVAPATHDADEDTKPSPPSPPSSADIPSVSFDDQYQEQDQDQDDRPLILYAYSESDFGRINLAFFVRHGLHDAADFIFILNGETDVDETVLPSGSPNVRVIKRENTCFDLGAHAEVLTMEEEQYRGKALKDRYKRFILMNASIRGPFVPHWSKECWSDAYLGRLNEKVKLVGSTINCHGGDSPHVQSMIWATDHTGLATILEPSGIGECFPSLEAAMGGEIRTTPHLRSKGYSVDVMLSVFQSERDYRYADCDQSDDFLYQGSYFGFNVHPFETLFVKSHRGIDDALLEKLSDWQDLAGYSSFDACRRRA